MLRRRRLLLRPGAAADSAEGAAESAEGAGPAAQAAVASAEGAAESASLAAEAAAEAMVAVESAVGNIEAAADGVSTTTDLEELGSAYNIAADALNTAITVGSEVASLAAGAVGEAARAQSEFRAAEAEVAAGEQALSQALANAQTAYQDQEAFREVVNRRAVEYLAYSPREWRTAEELSNTDYESPVAQWADAVRRYADAIWALAALDPAYADRANAAEEYATASQAVFQTAREMDDAVYDADRRGPNDYRVLNHVGQLEAITQVAAGAAVSC